jgi:trafficking protein particle complex subunit 4
MPATGIETLESSFFRLTVYQTLTGTKFLLFTDPSMPNTDIIMRGVYERYSDFVCKNPFWQMEMPIRIDGWEREITKWLTRR